jgi:hypothetical protein
MIFVYIVEQKLLVYVVCSSSVRVVDQLHDYLMNYTIDELYYIIYTNAIYIVDK